MRFSCASCPLQMSRQGSASGPGWMQSGQGGQGGCSADSGRDTVFSSDGSSSSFCDRLDRLDRLEVGDRDRGRGSGQGGGGSGASSGSSSSGVGSSHTPTATTPTTPTTPTAPEPTRPPRITPFSGVLSQGKAVIRPIAFRPLQGAMSPGPPGTTGRHGLPRQTSGGRLSNAGERYGSTPVLARPGTRLALHGSTTDLRSLHCGGASLASLSHLGGPLGPLGLGPLGGSGSHLSLDRKLTLCSSPPLSSLSSLNSLPLPGRLEGLEGRLEGRGDARYDPLTTSGTLTAPSRAGSVDRNLGHSHRTDAALRRLPLVGLPLSTMRAMHHGSADRVDGDLDCPGLPPDLELEAALRGRDSELAVRQREERAERGGWARELRRLQHAADSRLRQRHQAGMQHPQHQQQQHPQQQQQQQQRERHARAHQDLGAEVRLLRSRLEETSWALHQRNGEVSLLKAQLKEALSHQEQASRLAGRAQEAAALRAENRELRSQLERGEGERSSLRRTLGDRDAELQRAADGRDGALRDAAELRAVARHLEAELELAVAQAKGNQAVSKHHAAAKPHPHPHPQFVAKAESPSSPSSADGQQQQLRGELRRLREELSQERATWAEEKEKVLRYQRQLQLNYVQMFRRTRSLEAEVESLTMELELETKANKHKNTFAKSKISKGLPLPELHAQAIEL